MICAMKIKGQSVYGTRRYRLDGWAAGGYHISFLHIVFLFLSLNSSTFMIDR